jgi:hypothetical protein
MPIVLNPNDPRVQAYRSDPFPTGIDLRRSVINNDPGQFVVDPTATFRAGMVMAMNSSGQLAVCDGLGVAPLNVPFGFAKWNKLTTLVGAASDEPVVLTGVVASALKHSNLTPAAAGIRVSSAPNGGTVYTEGGGADYTVNYTNGTVVRTAGSTIPSGATVYVTYNWLIPEADLDFQGRNFWNSLDDVTVAQGRLAVITNWAVLYTLAYDPSITFTVGANLTVDTAAKAGLLTTAAGGRPTFGKCIQVPTADDPFLGIVSSGHY